MSLTKNPNYRPDIDGLRAVAVLLVVLFHAGLGFPGGYVGVDVFFVISGYLITGIIVREVESERGFSLARFWQRRIHRILPPVAAMMLVVLLIGPFLMRPGDLESIAKSAIAQTFMAANVRFARMPTGYFDTSSDLWPLLHTWSLAVEEQFYLFYPIVLAFLLRRSRKASAWFVWIVIAISLGGSIALTPIQPEWSFYLLPTRAWELGLGAALALWPLRPLHTTLSNAISLLGIGLILVSSWIFNAQTPFPGWQAIFPCLGAAMVVGTRSSDVGSDRPWLSNRLMVGIGLVSYSLYLWHWPVLALLRYYFGIHLSSLVTSVALLLMATLALLSYQWVELPLRQLGGRLRIWQSFACGALISGLVLVIAVPVWRTHGLDLGLRRIAEDSVRTRLDYWQVLDSDEDFAANDVPSRRLGLSQQDATFVVWGDSHAQALAPEFDECARRFGIGGVLFQRSSSPPLPLVWRSGQGVRESELYERWGDAVVAEILRLRPRAVILVGRWSEYLLGIDNKSSMITTRSDRSPTPEKAADAMCKALAELKTILNDQGIDLFAFRQAPRQLDGNERRAFCLSLWGQAETEGIELSEFVRQHAVANGVLDQCLGVNWVISPTLSEGRTPLSLDGDFLYWDDDHLSPTGAELLFGIPTEALLMEVASSP